MTITPASHTGLVRDAQPRTRRLDIEAMRILAAVLVITIHVTSGFISGPEQTHVYSNTYWVALLANMGSRCAVPVFFAISGWALIARSRQAIESAWLARRLKRLLVPLLVWDAVFVVSAWIVAQANGTALWAGDSGPIGWLLREAAGIAFGPGTGPHLWFMYYLVPLTIVLWLVQVAPAAIGDPRERRTVGIAAAGLLLPYGVVGLFGATLSWSVFGWALGYAVLGYVLIEVDPPGRWLSGTLYIGATVALVVAERLVGYNQWEMAYPGPLVLVQTIGLIGLARSLHVPVRWDGLVTATAKLTFGVYLVHLLFVQGFAITLNKSSTPLSVVLIVNWLTTVAMSFIAVAAWHRVRGLDRILG